MIYQVIKHKCSGEQQLPLANPVSYIHQDDI
jgi:hypothetical protein